MSLRMDVLPCTNSFASLHEDTELTDFELRGTDGAVRVHRAVLAAASPVLRRMLSGAWRETAEGYVDVPGTTSATLQHLKDYLYLHTLPESNFEQLLLLSSYYMMPDLKEKCVDRLVEDVSAANVWDMIEFAAKHKVTRLLLGILECVNSGVISDTDMDAIHPMMKPTNLVNKGNSLSVDLTVNDTTFDGGYSNKLTKTSPEFVINGLAVFQMKFVTTRDENGYTKYYHFIFARFAKQVAEDDLTYTIKFTSKALGVVDKRLYSDEDTWRLLHEINDFSEQITIDVSVRMDVLPCARSFASLHEDSELTDFELRGTDGAVRVHRAVLAAASPVLRRMLSGAWRETAEGNVEVSGTTRATLQHLKDYLYLHTLPESGLEQLLLLSSCYMMPDLEQKCVAKLVHDVSAANASDMIKFAATHNLNRLLFAILDCVQSSVISVSEMRSQCHLKSFNSVSEEVLK